MTDFVQLWVYLLVHAAVRAQCHAGGLCAGPGFLHPHGAGAPGQPGAVVHGGAGPGPAGHGHGLPHLLCGAQFIHFLLGPAVVALAWPLWERRAELRARWGRFTLASVAGGAAAAGSAVGLAWAPGLPLEVVLSLAPKSVTAPWPWALPTRLGAMPRWPQFLLW